MFDHEQAFFVPMPRHEKRLEIGDSLFARFGSCEVFYTPGRHFARSVDNIEVKTSISRFLAVIPFVSYCQGNRAFEFPEGLLLRGVMRAAAQQDLSLIVTDAKPQFIHMISIPL